MNIIDYLCGDKDYFILRGKSITRKFLQETFDKNESFIEFASTLLDNIESDIYDPDNVIKNISSGREYINGLNK